MYVCMYVCIMIVSYGELHVLYVCMYDCVLMVNFMYVCMYVCMYEWQLVYQQLHVLPAHGRVHVAGVRCDGQQLPQRSAWAIRVCMYCMYAYMYVCRYSNGLILIYERMYVFENAYAIVGMYVGMYVTVFVFTYVCMYVCMCVCVCMSSIRLGERGRSLLNDNHVPISHMWSPAFVGKCADWPSYVVHTCIHTYIHTHTYK